uniref:Pentapeptide repeat protein n=1 Tax=Siphoviridae sp. ctdmY20 TaxID=2825586 RepID=A0A8S5Q9U2_9CAUD|nr:MAG TPA: pentapeptide repeat protein [Siphoviridae sp. ctdmY20]
MNGKYYGRLEVRYHKKEAARLEHIKNKRKRSKTMVKGYKVFNPDWTCKGKQYTCPGTFEEDVNPSVCNVGMHFCKNAADCFRYYDFDPNNHVAEVIAHGTVAEGEDKCATNKLEIVREIPWAEVLEIVNTGKACTGRCNSGNRNSGDWNSGDWNSGNRNSGDCNSGNRNSGDWNSGDWNSGDWNSGNRNSGDWNKTSFSNGCFNTVSPKIYMFNKPTDWTLEHWLNCRARYLLNQIDDCPLEYVWFDSMTDEEKAAHPEAKTTGGYLKERTTADNARKWWAGLSADDRNIIFSLPNFDAAIFKEITGIDVDAE